MVYLSLSMFLLLSVLASYVFTDCTNLPVFFSNVTGPGERPLPDGGNVSYTCQVNTSALFWSSSRFSEMTVISSSSSQAFSVQNAPQVVAYRYVFKIANCQASRLEFSGTLSEIDGMDLKCENDDSPRVTIGNIIITVATVPDPPINITNASQTYQSVLLQWNPPINDGGQPIQYYFIDVTGGKSDCPGGVCITDSTNYNVTGLDFKMPYTFTVSANNSVGMSNISEILTTLLIANVPTSVSEITYCISRSTPQSSNAQLSLKWTCPVPISNPALTPPVTNYNATTEQTTLCSVLEFGCSSSDSDYCTFSVQNGQMIDVNVIAINVVGPSIPLYESIDADFDILNATVINVTSNSVIIQCTTNYTSSDKYCKVTVNGLSKSEMFQGTNIAEIRFDSLQPNTPYTFMASLVNNNNQLFPDACIIVNGTFTTEIGLTTTITTATTTSIATAITTTTTSIPTTSPSPSVLVGNGDGDNGSSGGNRTKSELGLPVIVGVSIGGVFIILLVIIVVIIIIFGYVKSKSKSKDLEPIPLVDRKEPVPETGQALYQDPVTIERQQGPTGDLYAMPDKGKGKGSRRQAPTTTSAENATYQDPTTIERQQAPTGDLYAMPEKKPKYSEVQKQNTNVVYTDVDVIKGNSGQPRGKVAEVVYSDLK